MFGIEIIGAITGLLGGISTGITNYKIKKLELSHKEKMAELDIKSVEVEAKCAIQRAEVTYRALEDMKDSEAYAVSQKLANQPLYDKELLFNLFKVRGALRPFALILGFIVVCLYAFVDLFRAIIRPALTLYQGAITTWLVYIAWKLMQSVQGFTPDMATTLFVRVADAVIFLTVSIFTWWFGDRATMKFLQKHTKFLGASNE